MDGRWRWWHVPFLVIGWLLLKGEQFLDGLSERILKLFPRADALQWYHLPLLPFAAVAFLFKRLRQWLEKVTGGRSGE